MWKSWWYENNSTTLVRGICRYSWKCKNLEIWRNWLRWRSSTLILTIRNCHLRQRWQDKIQDVKDTKFVGLGDQRDIMRYFASDGRGHRAVGCPAEHWRPRMSWIVIFSGAKNVHQQDTRPRVSGILRRAPSLHKIEREDEIQIFCVWF